MKRTVASALAAGLLLAVLTPGATASATTTAVAAAPVTTTETLPGGRQYLLRTSPGIVAPRPVVVALHGANLNPAYMEAASGLNGFSDVHNFVLVYGIGVDGRWNAGPSCCSGDPQQDVAYLRAVVADTAVKTRVDPDRVFVTGFSNGGMMAWRAVCHTSRLFAAAVTVAGPLITWCPNRVQVLHIHGTGDATVPWTGGSGFEGVVFPDSRTEPARISGGVWQSSLHPGGHVWPVSGTDQMWEFFTTHPRQP